MSARPRCATGWRGDAKELRLAREHIVYEIRELLTYGWACNQGYQGTLEILARRKIARALVKAALNTVKTVPIKRIRP